MKLKPSEIKIRERIRKDNGDIEALADSMGEDLQGAPITVTKDHVLIDGFRRLMAWKKQYGNVPLEVYVYEGETDYKMMEAKMLLYHKKPNSDEIGEAGEIVENIIGSQEPNLSQRKKDEIVADKLGIGRVTYLRNRVIQNKNLKTEIGEDNAKEIKKIANKDGIRTAYNRLKKIKQDMGFNKNFPVKKEKSDINNFLQECIDRQLKTNSVLKEILANKDSCDSSKLNLLFDSFKRTLIILKENKEVKAWKLLK